VLRDVYVCIDEIDRTLSVVAAQRGRILGAFEDVSMSYPTTRRFHQPTEESFQESSRWRICVQFAPATIAGVLGIGTIALAIGTQKLNENESKHGDRDDLVHDQLLH